MRYAAGLSLAAGLRAGVVTSKDIDDEIAQLARGCSVVSPRRSSPARTRPGVFWLDAKGLERLFGALTEWASSLHAELVRAGFIASLAVGFDRFAVYAVAKSRKGTLLSLSPRLERGNIFFLTKLPGRLSEEISRMVRRRVSPFSRVRSRLPPSARRRARFGSTGWRSRPRRATRS